MISIVCAYNNEEILNKALKKTLEQQVGIEYELLAIDSKIYDFKSAAETLNYAGDKANGEYIIFAHQDIVFENKNDLINLYNLCRKNKFGIAGVAGCVYENGTFYTISNIHHGKEHKLATTKALGTQPKEVDSLDECLIIVPKNIFQKYKFSNLGKTWHLYGTDYSLKMKVNGYKVLVLPIDLWHLSEGASLNPNYFDAIKKLAKQYKDKTGYIYTIFGYWPTSTLKLWGKCLYRKIRLKIRGV